jgi:choline dehydrogenase
MITMAYDYIIIGAGTAGCILANRLSKDPSKQVLLLEAGGKDNSIWMKVPAGFQKLLTHPKHNWCFKTEPEVNLAGRSIPIPRGKGIGGSSSINGMIYIRGQALDYNTWAQLGNGGWSFTDVLPYFKKSEFFERGGDEFRGNCGPLNVADMRDHHPIVDAFIDAGIEHGHDHNLDYNGAFQDGFGYYQVTQRNGLRVSAADAFLHPITNRKNLTTITDAKAKRLLMNGKHVTGVVYDISGSEYTTYASREVILSAGAVQSPQLLELSGIGQPKLLKHHGIEIAHKLEGVGENYRDHFATRICWQVPQKITFNEQSRGLKLVGEVLKYVFKRQGLLTYTAGIGHGFVKTRPELATPDIQFLFAPASFDPTTRALDKVPGMTIGISQMRPESKGSIHIGSSDPMEAPLIQPNFLSALVDQQTLVAGMYMARQIGEAKALAPYRSQELKPGIECKDDEALLSYAQSTGASVYHVMGTCKMGPVSDPLAVVDNRLKIWGLDGVRVVDASIMPTIPSGNINAPVMMIAEKAAAMIIEDAKY